MDADEFENVENAERFWEELDDVVNTPCRTHERIDDTLRTWLSLVATFAEQYVHSEAEFTKCAHALLVADLYIKNKTYVRRQLVEGLLQEDEPASLHLITAFLLSDGRAHDDAYEILASEGTFPRLVHLIRDSTDDDRGLHRLFLELMYEMARMQQLSWEDLNAVDDPFVLYLFQIIEGLSNDVYDPYHGPVMRAILVLNEQYLLSSTQSATTNRIIKTISLRGGSLRAFGESLILLLNRTTETSLQLLILKTLYLLFTTPSTAEYFYTNDLYVLTDILLRNVLDLPHAAQLPTTGGAQAESTASLRHTYLRVLHPLLANTQLASAPHYKPAGIRAALALLARAAGHFDAHDDTTVRLARRCATVPWLVDPTAEPPIPPEEPSSPPATQAPAPPPPRSPRPKPKPPPPPPPRASSTGSLRARGSSAPGSPGTPAAEFLGVVDDGESAGALTPSSTGPGAGQAALARRALGYSLPDEDAGSAASLNAIAAPRERPGVETMSIVRGDLAALSVEDQPHGEKGKEGDRPVRMDSLGALRDPFGDG